MMANRDQSLLVDDGVKRCGITVSWSLEGKAEKVRSGKSLASFLFFAG
jgi:hypothetical protein